MSDFTLIEILNLVRAEIARTEIGDIKKITGPTGEQGPMGETGPQGPQGPRGNDGKQGPAGSKGDQGKKGDKGGKGDDGSDGVGIARIDQDTVDGAIVVYLTDGNTYEVELPLIDSEGNLSKEVHYKTGGSGGDGSSGTVDLSGYVRRPPGSLKGSWLVYKEGTDGSKAWTPVTTDLVEVNPNPFRNAKGQFIGTPEELEALKNQRDVNEFLYNAISDIEQGDIDLEGYATEAQLNEVDSASIFRDEALKTQADEWDVVNTAAHLKLEDQILRCYAWSQGDNESLERQLTKVDEDLQAQIDTNKVESEDGDKHLQVEIEEIALALETLLVQREHGQWKYVGFSGDTLPRNAGEFALLVSDIASSQDNIITINQEDLKGITHGFGDVEVGDYVEIVNTEDPTSYALFTITKVPEGTGIVNVEVALKDAGYNIWAGETCEIRFFAINEQDLNLTDLDSRYLKLSGGTMTGILELPRFNVKQHDGEAICLIEGMTEGTASSARLTFSNKTNANAYGNLTWNGNSGQGWFQFNKDVDFSTKNLHSVNNIRLSGNKTIQESQTTRIQLDGKVIIRKAGTSKAGFVLKGATEDGADSDLFSVWHNAEGLDAVNYKGATGGPTNIATCEYVDSKVGSGGGSPASGKIQAGFQSWQASRLSEGCFNLLDESNSTTSNCKVARGLTFHTYTSYDEWPWMKWGLRSGGQIHLTDMNGKYLMSKPVLSVEKYDAGSGDNPEDALWFFELSIYGFESETSLSGLYMVEFENCMEA